MRYSGSDDHLKTADCLPADTLNTPSPSLRVEEVQNRVYTENELKGPRIKIYDGGRPRTL